MRAGKLNHRVTIEQLVVGSPSVTAIGEPDATWTTFATVWAGIEPLRTRELIAAQAVQSETTGTIRMRYLAGVTAAMRVVYGSRVFQILGIQNINEADRELLLTVSEGPSNG